MIKTSKKSFRSFTLIEIIIVLVIVGILAALTLPRMKVLYLIKLQGAGKALLSDIRYIQNHALSSHVNTMIRFRDVQEIYDAFVCDGDSAFCAVGANWVPLVNVFINGDLVVDYTADGQYSGITIDSSDFNGSNILRFDWEGVPQDNAGIDLTANGTVSLGYANENLTITVTPQTGMLSLSKTF